MNLGLWSSAFDIEDLTDKAIAELSKNTYALVIDWRRVLPDGRGRAHADHLDLYKATLDKLLSQHIQPYVILGTNVLPESLEDKGGWLSKDTAKYFADYVSIVASCLSNKVSTWVTHDEPSRTAELSFDLRAPKTSLQKIHNILLSHGFAFEALKSESTTGQIAITASSDSKKLRWILDPIVNNAYPLDILKDYHQHIPSIDTADMSLIGNAKIDGIGINFSKNNQSGSLDLECLSYLREHKINNIWVNEEQIIPIDETDDDRQLVDRRLHQLSELDIDSYFLKVEVDTSIEAKKLDRAQHTLIRAAQVLKRGFDLYKRSNSSQ